MKERITDIKEVMVKSKWSKGKRSSTMRKKGKKMEGDLVGIRHMAGVNNRNSFRAHARRMLRGVQQVPVDKTKCKSYRLKRIHDYFF